MGTDGVELVLLVEERFGITLSDGDLDEIQTVGQLHERVMVKLEQRRTDDAHCGILFYLLRRLIARTWELPPGVLRPETPLGQIIPRPQRRRRWERLQEDVQLVLPELALPSWVEHAIFVVSAGLGISGWWSSDRAMVGLIVFGMGLVLLTILTQPLATRLPRSCVTLGDLVYQVQSLNRASEQLDLGSKGTWSVLQGLVADLFQIPRDTVQPSTRLAEDLHVI